MVKDLGRSRRFNSERKQARLAEAWSAVANDRSWMKFVRCKGCGMKLCVNNNPKRQVDVSTIERAGGYIWRPGKKKTKIVMILCWRCRRFAKLFRRMYFKVMANDAEAIKLWDSFPARPYPGEL